MDVNLQKKKKKIAIIDNERMDILFEKKKKKDGKTLCVLYIKANSKYNVASFIDNVYDIHPCTREKMVLCYVSLIPSVVVKCYADISSKNLSNDLSRYRNIKIPSQ